MKHDWDYNYDSQPERVRIRPPERRCRNCGATQEKITEYLWMRVYGYRWEPLVGRCKGKQHTPRGLREHKGR